MPTGRRMVVYTRISDDREGRQYGVDRQERQCRDLAKRNGDEIVAVFVDDDRSAYSGKPRPDYLRMLELLRTGTVHGVYSLAPTRLYRRLDDGLEFLKLIQERTLAVETVKAGRYNLSTADGRRDALRAAVDAQHEAEQISERVRDAKADNAARGEFRGGPRPYGWGTDGVTPRALQCLTPRCRGEEFDADRHCLYCGADAVNKPGSEMWHIEQGIDGILAGESIRSLVAKANAAGARTPERRYKQPDGSKGQPESREWRPTTYGPMLLRARVGGLIEHDGEIIGPAQWPAAVTEAKWRAAREILLKPERRTSPGNARVWLLSGIAKCGVCQAPLKATLGGVASKDESGKRRHVATYQCRLSQSHVARHASHLDAHIVGLVLDRLSLPNAAQLLTPPESTADNSAVLAAEANALRVKLDGLAADYGADLITRGQMLNATATTRQRIDQIDSLMARRSGKSVLAALPLGTPKIAEQWPGYHLDRRRAIVSALMDITVNKARRGRPTGFKPGNKETYFDPTTIEIRWKTPGAE